MKIMRRGGGWSAVLHRVACLAAIAAMAAGTSLAGADEAVVASLAGGQSGTIRFESVTPRSADSLLSGDAEHHKVIITGTLSLPPDVPGSAAPVPAVIILHGSAGINPGEWAWALRMNGLGYASFVVDSFTGRGIRNTEKDQSVLSMTADIADAYAALRLLATDPRIDPDRIAVMGFSRGGVAALYASMAPFRRAGVSGNEAVGPRFAAHIAFYPSCGITFDSAHTDGAPILMLLGGKDNYTPAAPCRAYADTLRARGSPVTVETYPGAWHAFDRTPAPREVPQATSARECHGSHDLDARIFTMMRDGRPVTGHEAVLEARRCLTRGVMMGGNEAAREQSPRDVAAFLDGVFAPTPHHDTPGRP